MGCSLSKRGFAESHVKIKKRHQKNKEEEVEEDEEEEEGGGGRGGGKETAAAATDVESSSMSSLCTLEDEDEAERKMESPEKRPSRIPTITEKMKGEPERKMESPKKHPSIIPTITKEMKEEPSTNKGYYYHGSLVDDDCTTSLNTFGHAISDDNPHGCFIQ